MYVYCKDTLLADRVDVADTFIKKLLGLLGKRELSAGQGLLLKNCSSVHCFFMKFSIDVVYLSKEMKVLYIETVDPWHIGRFVKKTKHILELPAGSVKSLEIGERLEICLQP